MFSAANIRHYFDSAKHITTIYLFFSEKSNKIVNRRDIPQNLNYESVATSLLDTLTNL